MKEVQGNIWDFWEKGYWIVIPTNGSVKRNGEAVMGRGLALQAKEKFPELPSKLGQRIRTYKNEVFVFREYKVITFPVKENWWEKASLELIQKSCIMLKDIFQYNLSGIPTPIYLPRVGCGNGKLDWKDVMSILEYLDDKFLVCDREMTK